MVMVESEVDGFVLPDLTVGFVGVFVVSVVHWRRTVLVSKFNGPLLVQTPSRDNAPEQLTRPTRVKQHGIIMVVVKK